MALCIERFVSIGTIRWIYYYSCERSDGMLKQNCTYLLGPDEDKDTIRQTIGCCTDEFVQYSGFITDIQCAYSGRTCSSMTPTFYTLTDIHTSPIVTSPPEYHDAFPDTSSSLGIGSDPDYYHPYQATPSYSEAEHR